MTFCRNFLIGLFSWATLDDAAAPSTELEVCRPVEVEAMPLPSLEARSSAEFRRIMIVLVCGSFRLCSWKLSSLQLLYVFDFLIVL